MVLLGLLLFSGCTSTKTATLKLTGTKGTAFEGYYRVGEISTQVSGNLPASFEIAEGDPDIPTATLVLDKGQAYLLRLPATLEKNPPAQWIFWPSGVCEPANVRFKGPDGSWEVNYSPLTARPEIVRYAAK
jgi:hypothetical protein